MSDRGKRKYFLDRNDSHLKQQGEKHPSNQIENYYVKNTSNIFKGESKLESSKGKQLQYAQEPNQEDDNNYQSESIASDNIQIDTFRKLRDELFQQVDTERIKNKLLEEKLLSRDKSFQEMRSSLNELISNYSAKEKECELLRNSLFQEEEERYNKNKKNDQHQRREKGTEKQFQVQERIKILRKGEDLIKQNEYCLNQQEENEEKQMRKQSPKIVDNCNNAIQMKKEIENHKLENSKFRQTFLAEKRQEEISKYDGKETKKSSQYPNTNSLTIKSNEKEQNNKATSSEKIRTHGRSNYEKEDSVESLKKELQEHLDIEKKTKRKVNKLLQRLKEKEETIENNDNFEQSENDKDQFLKKAEELLKANEILKEENKKIQKENNNLCLVVEDLQTQLHHQRSQFREERNRSAALQTQINQFYSEEYEKTAKYKRKNEFNEDEETLKSFIEQQDKIITRLTQEINFLKRNKSDVSLQQYQKYFKEIILILFESRGDNSLSQTSITFGGEQRQKLKQKESQNTIKISEFLEKLSKLSSDYQKYEDFTTSFQEMMKSIGQNELPHSPNLNDCWRYFKLIHQQFLHFKANQEKSYEEIISHILKMLNLKNENQILTAVQDLLLKNEIINLQTKQSANKNSLHLSSNRSTTKPSESNTSFKRISVAVATKKRNHSKSVSEYQKICPQ